MKRTKRLITLVLALTLSGFAFSSAAFAGQDMFLKVDSVQGDSVDRAHAQEIDILSWSWGATNSATIQIGAGGGAGKAKINDLTITKIMDSSSPQLLSALATGKHLKSVVLTVRNQGPRPVDYFTLTLNDVLVSSYSTGTSNQDNRVTENFTFNFASFAFSFLPLKADGTPKQAVVTKFDILANKLL